MTAKEFVRKHMPTAKAERHKKVGGVYWLIREGQAYAYFASGTTEHNAWVNAKKRIEKPKTPPQENIKGVQKELF